MSVPSLELGPHIPSLASECASPRVPKGGGGVHTRLRVRGWGSPNSDDWRENLVLCLLCEVQYIHYPIISVSLCIGIRGYLRVCATVKSYISVSTVAHCNGNSVYIFLFWELRGLSPHFHIHVSLSDLYIPRISLHISSSRTGRLIVGIYNSIRN